MNEFLNVYVLRHLRHTPVFHICTFWERLVISCLILHFVYEQYLTNLPEVGTVMFLPQSPKLLRLNMGTITPSQRVLNNCELPAIYLAI